MESSEKRGKPPPWRRGQGQGRPSRSQAQPQGPPNPSDSDWRSSNSFNPDGEYGDGNFRGQRSSKRGDFGFSRTESAFDRNPKEFSRSKNNGERPGSSSRSESDFGRNEFRRSESNGERPANSFPRRGRHDPANRVGPVFGIKRLAGLLELSPDEVLLSIETDLAGWEEFLRSDDLTSKSDTLLVMAVRILGDKISSETTELPKLQLSILVKTVNKNLYDKISRKCGEFLVGSRDRREDAYKIRSKDYLDLDLSPLTFLTSFHKYGAFVARKMPNSTVDHLSGAVAAALGTVMSLSCMDDSFKELSLQYQELLKEIKSVVKKREETPKVFEPKGFSERREMELHLMDTPNDFREMTIVPTVQELKSKDDIFLRPNKIRGSYIDADHYLDVQFRLLREDFVQPLRTGIQDFMKLRSHSLSRSYRMPKGSPIRIYNNVKIISCELVRDAFVYKVQLEEQSYKRIKWERSKRLIPGSLLVFTSDYFENAYFAVVSFRNVEELSHGIVSVQWQGPQPLYDRRVEYLMVESEVYFEAYRHTLQTLKSLDLKSFVMSKFIVAASEEVNPPKYLLDAGDEFSLILENLETVQISPLVEDQWPSCEELGLDENQREAFKAAITKEFAIIQGPPGTGKTFIGMKLAEVLLNNLDRWKTPANGPIVVVCYTNHALDQFLEGILEISMPNPDFVPEGFIGPLTKSQSRAEKLLSRRRIKEYIEPSIIRLGSRSKSETLDNLSLHKLVRVYSDKLSTKYWNNLGPKKDLVYSLRRTRENLMRAVMELRDIEGIIDFQKLDIWKTLQPEFPLLWRYFKDPKWFGVSDESILNEYSKKSIENIVRSWFHVLKSTAPISKPEIPKPPTVANSSGSKENEADEEDEEYYDVQELLENREIDDHNVELESLSHQPRNKSNRNMRVTRFVPAMDTSKFTARCQEIHATIMAIKDKPGNTDKLDEIARSRIAELELSEMILRDRKNLLDTIFELYKSKRLDLPNVHKFLELLKSNETEFCNFGKLSMAQKWALYFAVVERALALTELRASEVGKELIDEEKKLQDIETYGEIQLLRTCHVVGMTTTGAGKYNHLLQRLNSKIVMVEEAAEVWESHVVTCITKHCEHLILIGDHQQLRPNTTVYEIARKYKFDVSLFERMLINNLNCYRLKVQHRMRPEIANLVRGTIYNSLENHEKVLEYPTVLGVTKNLFFISHTELENSESESMSKSNVFEAEFIAQYCRYLVLQGYEPGQITILTTYTGQMFLLKKTVLRLDICRGVKITCVDNYQGEENDIILLSLVRSNTESQIGFLRIENRVCVALSRAKHGLYIVGNMDLLSSQSELWYKIRDKLDVDEACGPALPLKCQLHDTISDVKTIEDFIQKVPEGGCNLPCNTVLPCTHKCTNVCHIQDREHKSNFNICMKACLKKCDLEHPCPQPCSVPCPPCSLLVTKELDCGHSTIVKCCEKNKPTQCEEVVLKTLPCGHEENLPCYMKPEDYNCKIKVDKDLPCGHRHKDVPCHKDAHLVHCKVVVTKILDPCKHEQETECRFSPDTISCLSMVVKTFIGCGHEAKILCAKNNDRLQCTEKCTIRLTCGHACTQTCHYFKDPKHLTYHCKKKCEKSCPEGHNCSSSHECSKPCPPCKKKVTRKLKCGHSEELECYVNPERYQCKKPCDVIRSSCNHSCPRLCYETCPPCLVPVNQIIPDCGHEIMFPCSKNPTQNDCLVNVKTLTKAKCSHDVLVPCSIRLTVTSDEILKLCSEPCQEEFSKENGGCGHRCSGTCGSCLQGRFHQKCQEQCGKALVCGHRCNFPCSNVCPPCSQPCLMKCEHSECGNQCGTPCQDCNEKCPWKCKHKRCTKLCKELCNREPCDEPCTKKLPCGHECIGFCGETCPIQCRICNKDKIVEDLWIFGLDEEDISSLRFVFLPDCKHAIEVGALTRYMHISDTEIGAKGCPLCTTVIRHCRRFQNIIKRRQNDIWDVKIFVFGHPTQQKIQIMKNIVQHKLSRDREQIAKWKIAFKGFREYLVNIMFDIAPPTFRGSTTRLLVEKQVDQYTLQSVSRIITLAEGAVEIINEEMGLLSPHLKKDLQNRYENLFSKIMARKLPLSNQEFKDFELEINRLFDLNQAYLRRSYVTFRDDNVQAVSIYRRILEIVLTYKRYTGEENAMLHTLLKELDEVVKTGLGITEFERKQITDALQKDFHGMTQGHWFKCPNGHVYVITECGGAMEEGVCNECGANIGGNNHQVLRDNALASEMDGAVLPAWPTAQHYD